MPGTDEIIDFLNKAKTEQPDKLQGYLDYYKNNYPEFYNSKIAPIFEQPQPAVETPEPETTEPSKAEPAPQASPNTETPVNEVLEKKSEPVTPQKQGNGLIILNWVALVFGLWIIPLILFLTTKDERLKKHAKRALIVAGILLVLGIILFIVVSFVLPGILFAGLAAAASA
ncbi:MAG: hypothetical protein JW791_00205 [Nanoarchaeota archaeon]|nr:hypothetical protein [Nanoarchaeota archaeon]